MLLRKALIALFVSVAFLFSLAVAQADTATSELFPAGLIDRHGNKISAEVLNGKLFALYFAAGWCQSCQGFTPGLVPFRNEFKDEFEVVFISSDKSKADQFAYMNEYEMLWPALEYRSKAARALKERFSVTTIPTLIVLSPEGKLLSMNGRQDINQHGNEALNHWKSLPPQPLPFTPERKSAETGSRRLELLNQQLIDSAKNAAAMPRHGYIKGTIGARTCHLAFDATSSTIKGHIGDFPVDIKVDKKASTITGQAHNSTIDLQMHLMHGEYRQEGDTYGFFFWHGIDWDNNYSQGGVSCSILELDWDLDDGIIKGFLGERKVNLTFKKETGILTGDLFGRAVDLQIEDLELTEFINHFYLFLK